MLMDGTACKRKKHAWRRASEGFCIAPHLSLTAGIGTLRHAGCRGFIGPFPPPLLIRYSVVDLAQCGIIIRHAGEIVNRILKKFPHCVDLPLKCESSKELDALQFFYVLGKEAGEHGPKTPLSRAE
jgi:hypothetical protein